jgi:thioredoxin-like negative regulator of GroEL
MNQQPDTPRPIPGWTPTTPAVDPASFDQLVSERPAVAVHFWAPWDAHDRTFDRNLAAVAPQFAGRVWFFSCNADLPESLPLCQRCGVVTVPSLAVFVRGQPCRPVVGVRSPEQLAAELNARLSGDMPKRRWWQWWRTTGG